MSKTEHAMPKLPRGWRIDRHGCFSDGSGTPWIEVHSPMNEGDYVCVESNPTPSSLKWTGVSVMVDGQDDEYDMAELARLTKRIAALRAVARKMRAWAMRENSRPHDPWKKEPAHAD